MYKRFGVHVAVPVDVLSSSSSSSVVNVVCMIVEMETPMCATNWNKRYV